ncbi:ABC transporter ATP-binding protein/permease [Allokutzneria sp. A3M-2-11 16]|uniref:ABC transporter ATP-binding protein n=1 Tax=Allokutzneria sp. A3M-2-11 16 TaxID=2962043 RepID=UPI0020B8F095|nr:ABC transporter ATP-binding protein [Allokutzneria sp. A3M-2-11 16]MCP3802036.1 ABC transporter ATP-binding protein/permease [Allokutzneria sp. A3M-2-11 16]
MSGTPATVLWGYTKGSRGRLGSLMLLELLSNAAVLIQPLVASWVLDSLEADEELVTPVVLLAVVGVLGLVLATISHYLLGRLGEGMVLDVRRGLVRGLLHARVGDVTGRPVGDVLARVGSDTTLLRHTLSSALVHGAVAPLVLVAALALMASIDPVLLVVLLVVLVVTSIAEWFALKRMYEAAEHAQDRVAGMLTALQRTLIAFRTVKAFGTEDREERAVAEDARAAYRAGVRQAWLDALVQGISIGALEVMFLVVLGVGATRIVSGELQVSDLVAFLLYVTYLRDPVENGADAATSLSEGLAAVSRVQALHELPAEHEEPAGTLARHEEGGLRLDQLCYSHDREPVLRGVSLTAGRGLTVLVGPSGAGKTTVLGLIERFDDPDHGRILLDGADIRGLPRRELRRRLAYVEQEAPLLGETLREAVLYGAPDTAEQDLDEVLRAVALDEWISTLPEGLDTEIGERGARMSGGQRQRLAVARAVLRRAEVLLLDEATSQLDGRSEAQLLRALLDQARVRTVIAVSHRYSLAAHADHVVLLDQGQVLAVDTHEELLRAHPLYRALTNTSDDEVSWRCARAAAAGGDGKITGQ